MPTLEVVSKFIDQMMSLIMSLNAISKACLVWNVVHNTKDSRSLQWGTFTGKKSRCMLFFKLQNYSIFTKHKRISMPSWGRGVMKTWCGSTLAFFSFKRAHLCIYKRKPAYIFECIQALHWLPINCRTPLQRNARNTMGTRGAPEWHPGLVAPMVRRPKWF